MDKQHMKFSIYIYIERERVLLPARNPPFCTPSPEKMYVTVCASFPAKERKKGTHINFFWVKKGVPKRI